MLACLQRKFVPIVLLTEGKAWVSHSPELQSLTGLQNSIPVWQDMPNKSNMP